MPYSLRRAEHLEVSSLKGSVSYKRLELPWRREWLTICYFDNAARAYSSPASLLFANKYFLLVYSTILELLSYLLLYFFKLNLLTLPSYKYFSSEIEIDLLH